MAYVFFGVYDGFFDLAKQRLQRPQLISFGRQKTITLEAILKYPFLYVGIAEVLCCRPC